MRKSPQILRSDRSEPAWTPARSVFVVLLLALAGLGFGGPAHAQSVPEPAELGSADDTASVEKTTVEPEVKSVARTAGTLSTTSVSQVASILPASGGASGGGLSILRGNFFQAGATVKVGGAAAGVVAIPSGTQINVAIPALPAGTLNDVIVTNPNGRIGSLPEAFFSNFTDVPFNDPNHDFVEQLVRMKVTAGIGGGNYGPGQGVTRGQMAVFLVKAKYGPNFVPPPAKGTIFADVPIGAFAAAYIEQIYNDGITAGCGGGNYCSASSITLEQMAVFILRSSHGISYVPPAPTGVFSDLPTTSGFAPWGEQVNREGVFTGIGGGKFGTGTVTSRAVMASMIVRAFQEPDVVRFLQQASWGPTSTLIQTVQALGIKGWLQSQFSTPSGGWPTLTLFPSNVSGSCNSTCQRDNYSMYPLQNKFFTKAMYDGDQLRQRVVFALHQILVISGRDIQQPSWVSPYLKILDANAFGNYRDILFQLTYNPGMGSYLNMSTSTKFNPNENYGREINQLFSVGLNLINPDGTDILDGNGDSIDTYTQTTIDNFALVFTGFYIANAAPGTPDYISPMSLNAGNHDTGTKALLNGFTLSAGQTGDADVSQAIDNIFGHPNLGPFVSHHLITELVTSNPSPGYIERVANIFNDDGTGVRGNLQAVVQAILLDPEARGSSKSDPIYGQLKEPAVFMNQILRAFDAKSANLATASDGVLNGQAQAMSQDIFQPPTVFNYYPADFVVPGTTNVSGPEYGIYTATEALRRANFVNTMVFSTIPVGTNSPNGTALDFSKYLPLSPNAPALVAELNRILMYNSMSTQMQQTIIDAVNAIPATSGALRVKQAVYLIASSSQFQVKR